MHSDAGQIADAIASVPAGQLPGLIFRITYTFDQDQETPLLEENNKAFFRYWEVGIYYGLR
ncbi:hypothetical protein [Candidatus Brachybacter algidus]|uniref:hypothetical protein n=1 Tax=Candidatus Brachybacter algidus TaxID=2982024 RepID=UPI001D8C7BB5|nr:hypothetical protein [Candidatus Brachybacter algidus]MBK6450088.1 hypothetical protein [Candidatus Brachybacter algidus]